MKKVLFFLVSGLICLFVNINVINAQSQNSFQQSSEADHLVVIEAENFHENIPGAELDVEGGKVTHTWTKIDTTAGYSGTGSMIAWPDANFTLGNVIMAQDSAACLKYRVNFVTTGPHYIWIRAHASYSTGARSYHVGFGDTITIPRMEIVVNPPVFEWRSFARDGIIPVVDIPTVGEHTFCIYMRQDGAQIDKILLTTNNDYQWFLPEGDVGPDESPRSGSGVGISPINDNNKYSMSIYPNPSNGITHLNFESNKVEDVDITIFNFVGQKLISKSYKSIPLTNGIDLPTQSLGKGIYLIQCKIAGQTQTTKLIKE